MSESLITIVLTRLETSELSLAAIQAGPSEHRPPALESARIKLRQALDKTPRISNGDGEAARYVALEC